MERILIIDDEASILKALKLGLASENYVVDLADDGSSGIQLGQTHSYDILITDLLLPDMNGLEVIRTLKSSDPEIVPIIITGQGSLQSSVEALRLEVCDYLEKPLSLPAVKRAIARGLQKRATTHQAHEMNARQSMASDTLTGLSDRSMLMNRLNSVVAESYQNDSLSYALFLIDIDHFKGVNDTYGHYTGDVIISELANRFKGCVRPSDMVARMNGDEFAVLIEGPESDLIAAAVAERCQREAGRAFDVDGQKVTLSVSIGLVVKTTYYESPDDVLRDADMALSSCKEQEGEGIRFFDQKMLDDAIESLQLENDLRIGIQNQEFMLHYQPILQLEDLRTIGLEALIRWHHPEHGIIYPDDFISKAEEIGLIYNLGNWVLEEGCRQLKQWQQTFPGLNDISLNLNISGHQFGQAEFADKIASIIADYSIDPGMLKFEITESVLMESSASAIEKLSAIKKIGTKLVLDDFGTGYSAFSYLHQFPLDELKIGKSFIQQMEFNTESYEIVKSVVELAQKLRLKVVAEGVETQDQFNRVKSLDFDMVQGFWFAKPGTASAICQHLENMPDPA
ncbi:MAG: EAL domain-containing protein [Desulfobacterales bacterium]|nr:EAL domain-containing protein [Desulfobacterales bacterium]